MTALAFLLGYLAGLYSHLVIAVIRGEIWRDSGARPGDPSFPDPSFGGISDPSWREREVAEGV
jgi:hypothetical protein